MPDLNVRNVDESLMRVWKKAALEAEMTLRDWVIRGLGREVQRGQIMQGAQGEGIRDGIRKTEQKTQGGDRGIGQGGTGHRPSDPGKEGLAGVLRETAGAEDGNPPVDERIGPFTGGMSSEQMRPEAGRSAVGAKCFCGSAMIWAKGADAGPLKWKCVQKGHYMTPRVEK